MIYLDSSVALARIFGEARRPSTSFWAEVITSSTLLQYEVWNRVHAHASGERLGAEVDRLLSGLSLIELRPSVLARALQPFPTPVRTLDGLHLATMDSLRELGRSIELASYDHRLLAAAGALGIGAVSL